MEAGSLPLILLRAFYPSHWHRSHPSVSAFRLSLYPGVSHDETGFMCEITDGPYLMNNSRWWGEAERDHQSPYNSTVPRIRTDVLVCEGWENTGLLTLVCNLRKSGISRERRARHWRELVPRTSQTISLKSLHIDRRRVLKSWQWSLVSFCYLY